MVGGLPDLRDGLLLLKPVNAGLSTAALASG